MAARVFQRLEPVISALAVAFVCCIAVYLAYLTRPAVPIVLLAGVGMAFLAVTRPVYVVYVALATVPLDAAALPIGAVGLGPAESLFALAGVGWALQRIAGGELPWADTPLTLPLFLLIVAVLPGIIAAPDDFQVLKRVVMWSAFFLTFNMIVAEASRDAVRNMLLILAVAGAFEGLLALMTAAGGPSVSLDSSGGGPARTQGTFNHPNTLGNFESMGLAAAVALSLTGAATMRLASLGLVALCTAGLTLSLSRGALLGAVAALVVFLALPAFRRAAVGVLAAGLVVAMIVMGGVEAPLQGNPQVTAFQERFSGDGPEAGRPDDRVRIWANTPRLIEDHPLFGVGAYNFKFFAVRYGMVEAGLRRPYEHAHNTPLTVAAEMGLVGLAAFAWVLFAMARCLIAACSRRLGPYRAYGVGVAAAVLATGIQGLVDEALGANAFTAMTLALVGGAVALSRSNPAPGAVDLRPA